MSYPENLRYTKDHEWLDIDASGVARVGITGYAIEQLGDIVHLDLPQVGEEFDSGSTVGTVESTKTVSDIYLPLAGKVVEVNDDLAGNLERLAEDPYDDGWLLKVSLKNKNDASELMTAKQYESFTKE